jgi:hypothetical protein
VEEMNNTSKEKIKEAIIILETEVEFISGDCGSIDLNVVAAKLKEAMRLLKPLVKEYL